MFKKVLLAVVVGTLGYVGYRRYRSHKSEQDLWAEATDKLPTTDER